MEVQENDEKSKQLDIAILFMVPNPSFHGIRYSLTLNFITKKQKKNGKTQTKVPYHHQSGKWISLKINSNNETKVEENYY